MQSKEEEQYVRRVAALAEELAFAKSTILRIDEELELAVRAFYLVPLSSTLQPCLARESQGHSPSLREKGLRTAA